MADALKKCGIYLDESNKLRVLEPEVHQQSNELIEEGNNLLERLQEFHKIADGIAQTVSKHSKEVENLKMKAIGTRNLLKFVTKQREAMQQEIQGLIIERSTELERLNGQYQCLQRVEMEQQEIMDQLVLHH